MKNGYEVLFHESFSAETRRCTKCTCTLGRWSFGADWTKKQAIRFERELLQKRMQALEALAKTIERGK
jgi:hypothetical protein